MKDLGHINEYIKKHSSSKKHINNVLDVRFFRESIINK